MLKVVYNQSLSFFLSLQSVMSGTSQIPTGLVHPACCCPLNLKYLWVDGPTSHWKSLWVPCVFTGLRQISDGFAPGDLGHVPLLPLCFGPGLCWLWEIWTSKPEWSCSGNGLNSQGLHFWEPGITSWKEGLPRVRNKFWKGVLPRNNFLKGQIA